MGKGYRTYAVAALVFCTGMSALVADPAIIEAIPPRWMGAIVSGLGLLMALLRCVTTTPPGQSGQ